MKGKLIIIIFVSVFLFFSCNTDPVNAMIENTTSILVKKDASSKNTATASITLIAQNDTENETEIETEELETEIDYEAVADTIFKSESYTYKSKYRRDPFTSVLELQREGLNEIEIETASYFGMIQGKNGKMALFKDATGMGYVFYEGQKIKNGVLLRIDQDSVIFKLQEYGTVRNKVIPLQTSSSKK